MKKNLVASVTGLHHFNANEIHCNNANNTLGEGGYGKVLIGFHNVLGELAIKCQQLTQKEEKKAKAKFEKEINLMRLARHKNVIRIEGVLKCRGWIGMVMEFMPAGSLHDLLTNESVPRIPVSLLLRMGYEVSDGITYLHNLMKNQRIAHGDLKPQNILLTLDLNCKIADFGGAVLSHRTGSLKAGPDKPGEGLECTLLFAAPERLAEDYDRLSTAMDVYSFGIILLVAITRKYPSMAKIFAIMQQDISHISFDIASLQQMREDMLGSDESNGIEIFSLLEDLMTKCISKHPENRPAMIDVRDGLQKKLKDVNDAKVAGHVASVLPYVNIRKVYQDFENSGPIDVVASGTKAHKGALKKVVAQNMIELQQSTDEDEWDLHWSHLSDGFRSYMSKLKSVETLASQQYLDGALRECNNLRTSLENISLEEEEAIILGTELSSCAKKLITEKKENSKAIASVSVLLLQSAGIVAKCIFTSTAKLGLIKDCAHIFNGIILLVKDQADLDFMDIIESLETQLSSIQSTKCNDKTILAEAKAACWQCMAQCYEEIGDTDQGIDLLLQAVTLLENVLGASCKEFGLYGSCCNNLAVTYRNKENPKFALLYYRESLGDDPAKREISNVHISVQNICKLVEEYPTLDKESDTLEFLCDCLQHHEYQKDCFLEVQSKFFLLRLKILLNKDDIDGLCNEAISALKKVSLSQDDVATLCFEIGNITKQLYLRSRNDMALRMIQCGSASCKQLSPSPRKSQIIVEFFQSLLDSFSKLDLEKPFQRDKITKEYRPLLEELSTYAGDDSFVDGDFKVQFRTLRAILFYQMIINSREDAKQKKCLIL
ncbi:uncharacterized protein LOC143448619 [Clavelina lepadiformis]|uniref:uncharacterized protein LOC143448619 n=1 Tax=Clavelina lepadiformis TaxID=159417 RepID=UPI004041CC60